MKILEILDQRLIGKRTKAEGFLMVTSDNIYIAPNEESSRDINHSILLVQDGFRDKLDSSELPPWGGGIAIYRDLIEIEGILCESMIQPFPIAITNIFSAVANVDGEIIPINVL